jgi:uncharacterized protein (DUF169 family)
MIEITRNQQKRYARFVPAEKQTFQPEVIVVFREFIKPYRFDGYMNAEEGGRFLANVMQIFSVFVQDVERITICQFVQPHQ